MKLKKNMIYPMVCCVMLAVFMFAAVFVYSERSHAWFVNNHNVDATGMELNIGDNVNYLLGTKGAYDDLLCGYTFEDGEKVFSQGTVYGEHYATGSDVAIRLRSDDGSAGERLLAPGCTGEVTFYIISKTPTNGETVNIKLDLSGYTKSGTVLSRSASESTQKLLKGHILFFQTHDGSAYSDLVQDGELIVQMTDDITEVTVYWVWEGFFSNYTDSTYRGTQDFNKIAWDIVSDIDAAADGEYHSKYFNQIAVSETYADNNEHHEFGPDWHGNNIEWMRRSYLNDKYNEADQMIGIDFDFILLEITLEQQ